MKKQSWLLPVFLVIVFGASTLTMATQVSASNSDLPFLSVRGTQIVDSTNRTVILQGVNYPGYSWCDSDSELQFHKELDYSKFTRFGLNVVRLPIAWCMLERSPGAFQIGYLENYISRDVRLAKKYGLYVVLDMHQWKWADKFGGSGAPYWTVKQYPPTELGERMATSNFWVNETLQEHFISVWTKIAARFANEPAVAGYDIINEPFVYTSVVPYLNSSYVDAFYVNAIKSIRTVDTKHIIFLEPSNLGVSDFPISDKIVWSPHFYPLAFYPQYHSDNITQLEADLAAKYKQFVVTMKRPMWIGEFGAFMAVGREAYLEDAKTLFAKYNVGWAWWAYSDRVIPDCLVTTSS